MRNALELGPSCNYYALFPVQHGTFVACEQGWEKRLLRSLLYPRRALPTTDDHTAERLPRFGAYCR
jgi:hypothetical protein